MELQPEKFKKILPLPVTVISTCNGDGIANAAPYSCVMPVLRPLDLIAFASNPHHDTLKNIHETGQFVVNVMGRPSFEKAIKCAGDYPAGVNELEEVGLETFSSKRVKAPRVRDAVGWIEAEKVNQLSHDDYTLIVGKVVCAEMNDQYVKDGELNILPILLHFPYFRDMGKTILRRDAFDV
jgi:flavin reductase (DIM6/NTAB) family NADH-FMN oxidoreductase RutF